MTASPRGRLLSALAGLAALMGCAVGGRMQAGAYVVSGKGYRVVPPPGWERVETEADVALRHATLEAGLMAHATCGDKTAGRPLVVLARHLRIGLRDVGDVDQRPVAVAGWPGVRSHYRARLDGVPVSVEAVTIRGRRCVYDLVVVAPSARFDAVAEEFERFARSFEVMEAQP